MADLTPEQRARVEEAVRALMQATGAAEDACHVGTSQRFERAMQVRDESRAALLATVEAVVGEARRYPHVVTIGKGTSYCELAQSGGKDTARLDWLESHPFLSVSGSTEMGDRWVAVRAGSDGDVHAGDGPTFRAAIDAALAATPTQAPR